MTRPFLLGLTGSIGMGKSTTSAMFAAEGVPVWDADFTVHRLYSRGGSAVAPIAAIWPDVVLDCAVDRSLLKVKIASDPNALSQIESIVHPLVAKDRATFIASHSDDDLVVFDIPLLFETSAHVGMDGTLVVSAPQEVQRARVLARPGMTGAQLDAILSRQMPDAAKRARADWVIETTNLEAARAAVRRVIAEIKEQRHA